MSIRLSNLQDQIRRVFRGAPFSWADAEGVALRCGLDPRVIEELHRAGRFLDFGNGVMRLKDTSRIDNA
jgi:hypothetical protein